MNLFGCRTFKGKYNINKTVGQEGNKSSRKNLKLKSKFWHSLNTSALNSSTKYLTTLKLNTFRALTFRILTT